MQCLFRLEEARARRFLVLMNVLFIEFMGPSPKTLTLVLGSMLSIATSSGETFHILGLLRFSGSFNVTRFFSVSMLIHSSLLASPDRMAVSFRSMRNVDVLVPQPLIRLFLSE